jgi:hypothetical protein
MLGDLELSLVQRIETEEEQVLVDHAVPGMEGNFTQRLNRASTRVTLHGVLTGDEAKANLEKLRAKFHAAEPLPFVADIMTATQVQQVLIADLRVQEVAGKPDRFEYRLRLDEYIPPPPDPAAGTQQIEDDTAADAAESQEAVENQVEARQGTIEVTVELSDPNADLSQVKVQVQGQTEDGQDYTVVLDEQTNGVFRKTNVPAGQYTVTLLIAD